MRHTGQRQYKCQLCSYTCIQTISLKTHMRNKHPNAEGIHICPYCKFRTVNKRIYNNHMSDHRNGLIPTALKVVADVPETSSAGSRAGNIVSHDNNLQVVQLKYETDGGADGVKKETSDFSTTAGSTVVVSESGGVVEDMDSVLLTEGTQAQSMVVTEAGQLVEGVVVVATGAVLVISLYSFL
nr:hypothetical protein BaRGS_033978 [Batillaria attramentaria]